MEHCLLLPERHPVLPPTWLLPNALHPNVAHVQSQVNKPKWPDIFCPTRAKPCEWLKNIFTQTNVPPSTAYNSSPRCKKLGIKQHKSNKRKDDWAVFLKLPGYSAVLLYTKYVTCLPIKNCFTCRNPSKWQNIYHLPERQASKYDNTPYFTGQHFHGSMPSKHLNYSKYWFPFINWLGTISLNMDPFYRR